MKRAGLPVPDGFILTTEAYHRFRDANGLGPRIESTLLAYNPEQPSSAAGVSRALQQLITQAEFPGDMLVAILNAYARLMKPGAQSARVSVRSSAVAEDSADHSFAGLFETFLNVEGPDQVLARTKQCWASAFTCRALAYRARCNLPHDAPMAVVVQLMADAEKSGVMFTANPATGDASRLIIEAAWGLGEVVVQGAVTPDHVELDRATHVMVEDRIAEKERMLVWDPATCANVERELTGDPRATAPVLAERDVQQLARLAESIERLYGAPQDVEFAVVDGDVFVTQCRPITTGGGVRDMMNGNSATATSDGAALRVTDGAMLRTPGGAARVATTPARGHPAVRLADSARTPTPVAGRIQPANHDVRGLPASPGRAAGAARVLASAADEGQLLDGEVLVTRMTTPDWVPAMRRAAAIVTDAGGMTSHAAIVARELGIPCVVGARDATARLATGTVVTVDGSAGTVRLGVIETATATGTRSGTPSVGAGAATTAGTAADAFAVTATQVYVNLAEPARAAQVAEMDVDGVGLLRAEFMLLSAFDGCHPREVLARDGADALADRLAAQLEAIAAPFHPRPVIYRAMDFRSNEFRNLRGGDAYEPCEENPMIGYRGCFRYTREPELFDAELRALARVRARFDNVHLMLPFVRTPADLAACLQLVDASPLGTDRGVKRWIMAEVPSVVHRLPEYAALGIDGVSIGSNDLTQLMLGIDRDSEVMAVLWDERDAAVLAAIRSIIAQCRELGLTCSICGQAPSVHEGYAQHLVEWGIDSISVNPDAIGRTRRNVAVAERRLLLEAVRREGVRARQPSQ